MNATRPHPAWWIMTALAALIAAKAFALVVVGEPLFPSELRDSLVARPWGIYPHALLGGIALLVGPFQFHRGLLRNRRRHRLIGAGYLIASLGTGTAGLYLAFFSYGGPVTHLGFGGLAVALLGTSAAGYRAIRARDVARHREWMILSYALIFAAATLRVETGLLMAATSGDFELSYRVVSWLCWVPNLLVAQWYVLRSRPVARAALPAYGG